MEILADCLTSDLLQLRSSREETFERLYESCFPRAAQLVRALGGSYDDARDVFQDALVILYEKAVAGQLDIQVSASAYVLGIVKHLWARQRGRDAHLLTFSALEREIELPEDFFDEPPRPQLRLFRFLAAAGRKCMDILQAFYYQNLPLQEIAEEFGFSNARSATVQKHKCLEKIRNQVNTKSLRYEEVVE
jgi:RNA polymerase sigma factor (sigma-70 family)